MGAPEIISLSVSIASLLVAVFAARYSYNLGARQVHLAARIEFMSRAASTDVM